MLLFPGENQWKKIDQPEQNAQMSVADGNVDGNKSSSVTFKHKFEDVPLAKGGTILNIKQLYSKSQQILLLGHGT